MGKTKKQHLISTYNLLSGDMLMYDNVKLEYQAAAHANGMHV